LQLLAVPPDETLRASTLEYGQVLAADEEQLRQWFAGKVVLIGNARTEVEQYPTPDGREVPGCYLEAAAVDALIREVFVRMPRVKDRWVLPLTGAGLGCLAGLVLASRSKTRYGAVVAGAAIFFMASVLAYGQWLYLFNPLLPIIALLLAAPASAWIRRLCVNRF